jgi:hypothetical protein
VTACLLPVVCVSDSQETMATRAGYLAHSEVMRGGSFYNLPSDTKRKDWRYPAASSLSTKFTDRVSVGGNVGSKEPKSDAKIKLGETGRASTAWRSDSSTISIEESFGQT